MNLKLTTIQEAIQRKINQNIGRCLTTLGQRPGSYPYLSGDGFRKLADHLYDETERCQSASIQAGQIIFVKSDKLPEWFDSIHPQIQHPYILLSHNSDYNIGPDDINRIDSKIIRWFAQNAKVNHPKLTPLPLGLNNRSLNFVESPGLLARIKRTNQAAKKNKIFFAFSISTNPPERQPAFDHLKQLATAEQPSTWIRDLPKYLQTIATYKFIAAPDGNGNDDPRRWQAMYLGIVPIVKQTISMDYFRRLGLPLWIINDWSELAGLTEADLAEKYRELEPGFNSPALWFDYWAQKIRHHEA